MPKSSLLRQTTSALPLKVLVVEDDPSIRSLIVDILAMRGLEVRSFGDGRTAWEACQREYFPLLVLDWSLPELDGLELCRRVRTLPGYDLAIIIVVTARNRASDLEQVLDAGADDYIPKPFEVSVLDIRLTIAERRVAGNLERRRAAEQLQESEARFKAVWDMAAEAVVLTDRDGIVISANPAYCQLYDYSEDEIVGESFAAVYPLDEREAAIERYRAIFDSTEIPPAFETTVRRADGSVRTGETLVQFLMKDGERTLMISMIRDVTKRKEAEETVRQLAFYDSLTGLPNRLLLADRLAQVLARARRNRKRFAVLYLDLDGFKPINDTLGHAAGDRLLKLVGQRLQRCVRQSDTVGRLGGDEFIVLLSDPTDAQGAVEAAQRILSAFRVPFDLDGRQVELSTSIGIAVYPTDGRSGETLIQRADAALYRAKRLGKSRYCLFRQPVTRIQPSAPVAP